MTPNLSLQVYAEPFVSAGDYSNYKELVDGRADRLRRPLPAVRLRRQRRLQHPLVPHDQRAALGVSTRVRTLFLVWQQGRSDDQEYGDFRFGRDFSGVFTAPVHNIFLIKFSYWLNM